MSTHAFAGFRTLMRVAVTIGIGTVCISFAENIIFPHIKVGPTDVSGIVDITLPPYSADKTGKTDVTTKLQQAWDDHQTWTTIYLPNGTYLVSNTIRMSPICTGGSGGAAAGCVTVAIMQGQSRDGTVIKLASGSFTNASSPKPVIFAADGVAQQFQRGIHNLTVLVSSNNAGANGIRWYSNNTGLMSDVATISQDGLANVGVDAAGGEQGPCGMRDIYVKGFKYGCKCNALNSVTVLNLTVENASVAGVLNEGGPFYVDHLISINNAIGVRNTGYLTLTNAQLTGGTTAHPAIDNSSQIFVRNVQAQGYSKALNTNGRTGPSGMSFAEYSTNQMSLFTSPTHSMNLPNKTLPDVPWEQDTTKWGNVWQNKGGIGTTPKSDSASLQSLIDNPNITSIIVPAGRQYAVGDIYVRGNIKRIVGTGGNVTGRFIITNDLTQPVIKIERFNNVLIVDQSNKTVIIESCNGSQSGFITSTGSGDLYICDIVGAPNTFNNASQRVWAWQYNAEGGSGVAGANHIKTIIQNIGMMRIFGWKDEPQFQSLDLQKGIVEILGYMYYASSSTSGQTMFVVGNGAQFCAAGVSQVSFNGTSFSNLVQQTSGGTLKTLTSSNSGSGGNIPLYCGYDSALVSPFVGIEARNPDVREAGMFLRIGGEKINIAFLGKNGGAMSANLYSFNGSLIQSVSMRRGVGAVEGPMNAFLRHATPGPYVLSVKANGRSRAITLMVR